MTRSKNKPRMLSVKKLALRLKCMKEGHKPIEVRSRWADFIEKLRIEGEDVTTHAVLTETYCATCGVKLP